jgi:hypothetical protein
MNEVAHTEFCYYYQNRGERCSAQLIDVLDGLASVERDLIRSRTASTLPSKIS